MRPREPDQTVTRRVRRLLMSLAGVLGLLTTLLAGLPATTSRASAAGTPATKVLVFVEENHSLDQMSSQMPYAFSLAKRYGYADAYLATTHPSLPNYLSVAGGSTFAVVDDKPPAAHRITSPSVFGAAIAAGASAKTYNESMTSNCQVTGSGQYGVRHNPWAYFSSATERANCLKYDRPFTAFAGDVSSGALPTVGMVIPNLCHDGHDCSLATADSWFRAAMTQLFAGPDWKAGRLVVILTGDEDDHSSGNKVLTVVIHPSQNGHVVSIRLTHYSMTRLYADVAHAPRLGAAGSAPSLSGAFGLPLG